MLFRTLLAVCVLLQGTAGPAQKTPTPPPPQPELYTDPEAYAVYAVLLSKRLGIPHSREFSESARLIIRQELEAYPKATAKNLDIEFAAKLQSALSSERKALLQGKVHADHARPDNNVPPAVANGPRWGRQERTRIKIQIWPPQF